MGEDILKGYGLFKIITAFGEFSNHRFLFQYFVIDLKCEGMGILDPTVRDA